MTQPIQQQYANAWADLHERITGGLTTLADLVRTHPTDPDNVRRLNLKRAGLDDALTLWEGVNTMVAASGDYAAGWHSFTDAAVGAWKATGDPASRSGVALALSYQRGYSPDIDAPPLHLLVREGI